METATAVGDGKVEKLTNELLGAMQRRLNGAAQRVNDGYLTAGFVLSGLQDISEGKGVVQPVTPFREPSLEKRRTSKSPYGTVLGHYAQRLHHEDLVWERLMARMWEARNIPHHQLSNGKVPVQTILGSDRPNVRDVEVVAATLQYLATSCGAVFLRDFVRTAGVGV